MTGIERLETLEELRALKGRYFHHLDRQDWNAWGALFADDAVIDVSSQFPEADPEQFRYRGRAAIVATVSRTLTGIVTAHHGHTPLLTIEDRDTASGVWAMEDNLFLPDGSRMQGYGRYEERYVRRDEAWRIAKSALIRSKVIFLPAPPTS